MNDEQPSQIHPSSFRTHKLEMARGWESKAVADQVEEAEARARKQKALQDVSPAARARSERLASLNLSRARTLDQLERATRPAHREMLQRTLRALEKEIDNLSSQQIED